MNASSNSSKISRNFGLDLFRSVAIILVVLRHGDYLLQGTFLEGFPYIRMLDGVDLFFVLSGFLIGGILLREINSKEHFGGWDLIRFWKRRWFRTLPNYYLILLANYIVVNFKIIDGGIDCFNWKFFFFLQNLYEPFFGFFWESWSLSVEEWFYIFSPVLLFFLLKVLTPKRAFLVISLVMIILPVIYRISILNPKIDPFWYDITFRKVVLARLDSIAYGLFAAWIYYYYKSLWDKFKIVSFMTGVSLIIFILYFESDGHYVYEQVTSFSLASIAAMLLLPFVANIRTNFKALVKVITHISKISYSMYLINMGLVASVIRVNFFPGSEMDAVIKYVVFWAVVILASAVLYKFFEKPVMNLRDK